MKTHSSILIAAMALSLAACGTDDPNSAAQGGPAQTPAPATAPDPAATPSAEPVSGELLAGNPVPTAGASSLNADCNIEGVDGQLFEGSPLALARDGLHKLTGWVVNADSKSIPSDLQLVVTGVGESKGTWTASSPRWIDRAGVAQTRGYDASLNNSGFAFDIDVSKLEAGTYHAYVMSQDGGLYICDPGRQISVE